jgi:hypothetical protein
VKITDQQSWRDKLEEAGLRLVGAAKEGRRLKFHLSIDEAKKHRQLLKELFQASSHEYEA